LARIVCVGGCLRKKVYWIQALIQVLHGQEAVGVSAGGFCLPSGICVDGVSSQVNSDEVEMMEPKDPLLQEIEEREAQ
jgi:hypothetical protein